MVQAARLLAAKGFFVVPINPGTKLPPGRCDGWSTGKYGPEDIQGDEQLGVVCGLVYTRAGKLVGHLGCADLDHPAALQLRKVYLPVTGMCEGRPGKKCSHLFYVVTDVPEPFRSQAEQASKCERGKGGPWKKAFNLPDGTRVIDFLGTGSQVMVAPSTHPGGEVRTWMDWDGNVVDGPGEPAVVTMNYLWDCVCNLARAAGCEKIPEAEVRSTTSSATSAAPAPAAPAERRSYPHEVSVKDRRDRAGRYLAKIPASVHGQEGDKQMMKVAYALVRGFDLTPDQALPLILRYDRRSEPAWGEAALVRKLQIADKFTGLRGSRLIRFTNFDLVPAGERKVRVGRSVHRIAGQLHAFTDNWPRRAGGFLFAPGADYKPVWLEDPVALFAWISSQLRHRKDSPVHWAGGVNLVTQAVFHRYLTQQSQSYAAVAEMPHYPAMPNVYYLHPPVQGGNGEALGRLLAMFNPEGDVDRDLLKAVFLTLVWGGPPGRALCSG
jgi:hypothetical protein